MADNGLHIHEILKLQVSSNLIPGSYNINICCCLRMSSPSSGSTASSVRNAILANEAYPANGLPDKHDRLFFDYMNETMFIPPGEESASGNFAAHLLTMLGYDASLCAEAPCTLKLMFAWSTKVWAFSYSYKRTNAE